MNLFSFEADVIGAWEAFLGEMRRRGWSCVSSDSSKVHLEAHERGKNKGFYQCMFKQFWIHGAPSPKETNEEKE